MKLIGTHTSPYVRKVRVVLAEKKMDYDFVVESPRAPGSTLLDINPLGRVPTLVLDDDTPLFDSSVIVEYIDASRPTTSCSLLPTANAPKSNAGRRWRMVCVKRPSTSSWNTGARKKSKAPSGSPGSRKS